jgi:mRNA interferase HigB
MHVISQTELREAWTLYPELEKPLRSWNKIAAKTRWECFADVRTTFRHADQIGKFAVFNILGNRYRLICVIHYNRSKVFIRHLLTHAEYDRGRWKPE